VPLKASLKHSEQSTNNIILLKQAAQHVQPVYEALAPANCDLLMAIRGVRISVWTGWDAKKKTDAYQLCEPEKIEPILAMINNVINEDVSYSKSPLDLRNQRCYAVKAGLSEPFVPARGKRNLTHPQSGVNGLLDVARQTYKEATEDVHTLVEEIITEHDLQFELRFEAGRGYFLRLPASDLDDKVLPPVFVNVVKRKRFVELTTLELLKRNKKVGYAIRPALVPYVEKIMGRRGTLILEECL
jgi:DNA mismatch repair protein MSH4